MPTRRQFLQLSFSAVALSGVANFMFQSKSRLQKLIEDILSNDLKGLKVQFVDIEVFARKAAEINPWGFDSYKWRFVYFYNQIDTKYLPLPFKYKYKQFRAEIVGCFLLSTNFFKNKMDETMPIEFEVDIYNPYKMPCGSPFSATYYKNENSRSKL